MLSPKERTELRGESSSVLQVSCFSTASRQKLHLFRPAQTQQTAAAKTRKLTNFATKTERSEFEESLLVRTFLGGLQEGFIKISLLMLFHVKQPL